MAINVKDKLVTLESLGVAYSAEQDAREEADQALSTRIDNIVAPEGDPSLTEVSDARVSGSTTHNTLKARLDADKAAVETEISQLSADLDDVNERIDGLGDGVPTEVRQAMLALFQSAAYAETGLTDEITVIESWAAVVTAISLNQSSISISGASTSQLVATTTPTGGAVIWASSDTSVATVSGSGLVTGAGNGSCTITASCGGKIATCSVTVSGFATLTSITATYTQSGTVYDTDTLDSLKSDLVVVASYSDSTTRTLSDSDYALSGTLELGTSTIVVSYGGETATFNVNVSVVYKMTDGDFIKVNAGFVYKTTGSILYLTTNQSAVRRSFVSATGTTKLMQSSDDTNFTESEYYPIRIPSGTNTVTVSITPSARYVGISAFSLNNGVYETLEGTTGTGWQQGQCSLAIPNSDNAYLNCASKYANSGSTTYSQEPTEVTITFS